MENNEQTKLAAIVFTDIVGYTQKMDANEKLTMSYLDRQRKIVYPIVDKYRGKVLKEIGDGLLMMFDSSVEAVRCVIEIQTQLKDEEFKIRAGVHMGDVILKDGDVFGAAVNIAARIEPQAMAGGISISQVVRNQIRNKIDIRTVSIGHKELKGVKESMEVFDVLIGDEERPKISLLTHLWQRRVPHITAIYAMLVLFTYLALEYISASYLLSPHIVQFGTVLLLSLFPSAILIGYFHGKKASGEWTKIERFVLPINLVISAVLLFTIFSNKDLGAATKNVNIIDEDGQVIEREITKSEFRKSMAIFFFENKSSDTTLNWLQYSVPYMIEYDLLQDIFIRSESSFNLFQEIIDEGYSPEADLPLIIQQKIANQRHLNYFVTGKIKNNEDSAGLVVSITVRKSNTSKIVAEKDFYGTNIFEIVDDISLQLKYDLKIPERHIEDVRDLPIAEMLTSSEDAIKSHIKAMSHRFFYNDYEKAQIYGEKAVTYDSSFIMAYAHLIDIYISTNQKELSDQTFEKVMQNIIRLPEQIQFSMKYSYYLLMQQDTDRAIAVVKMWKDLYPYDIQAYELSATLYLLKDEQMLAIAEYESILDLDPERYDYYLEIADLYYMQGKYDEAFLYNKKYADQFPESSEPYIAIGNLHYILRNFELAKANFEKVLLLEYDNISAALGLANINLLEGKYDLAESQYTKILDLSKTPQEKFTIYDALTQFYEQKGQMNKALECTKAQYLEHSKYTERINVIVAEVLDMEIYVKAGKSDIAFEKLKGFETELKPPVDKFISMGYLGIYMELNQVDNIEAAIVDVQDMIQSFQYDILQPLVTMAQAEVFELKGIQDSAIKVYTDLLEINPTRINVNMNIGICYRKLGQYDKAFEHLQIVIERSPFNPRCHYEMGLLYAEQGQKEKAIEHLKFALEVWKDADANFEKAKLAKAKYEELKG